MPGGRPRRYTAQPQPELIEISAYFRDALAEAGFPSLNAFLARHPFDKNPLYGLFNGDRFLTLEACRAIAVALGRKPDEVEPLWWQAKRAMERTTAVNHPPVTSWDRLPWPSVALRDVLEAQAQAVDLLPYRLLGVEPPLLSAVYVRQQARSHSGAGKLDRKDPRPDGSAEREPAALEQAIPVTAAFDKHEHLILTGEPGAGKSTFGQYLALRLSEIWLRTATAEHPLVSEPVVPIRVPARGLTGARSWAAALAAATHAALGLRLVAEPQPALFERRPLGVRWLVIVDGLDEIVDRRARTEVIQAIAARCRVDGDYRLVVTTRQLPDAEFALLRTPHSQTYVFEPFGRDELRAFAGQWFTAQRSADPEADASRFLRQVADGRLRELVRNPLLATIAAISYTLEPRQALPRSRLSLYERFVDHLFNEDSGRRGTLSEQLRMYASEPDRRRFVEWIHASRLDLLRHVASTLLAGEDPLLEAASGWIEANRPASFAHLPNRPDDVRAALLGTGLIVEESQGLRFLHHSFAEFLAAQVHATEVGPEFTGLETWIAKGLRPAEREAALFLFALWSRQPGNDPARIMDRLLVGHPERALLAGRLLAELDEQSAATRSEVLNRIFGLGLFHSAQLDADITTDSGSMLRIDPVELTAIIDVLGRFVDDNEVIERLRRIAGDRRLALRTRILATHALGSSSGAAESIAQLAALTPEMNSFDCLDAARAAIAIAPDDRFAHGLLERICHDVRALPFVRAQAAAELVSLGESELARLTARNLVLSAVALQTEHLERAVETWLGGIPTSNDERRRAAEALNDIDFTARQQASVAEALVKVGLSDLADRPALNATRSLAETGYSIRSLLAAWMHPSHPLLDEVVESIRTAPDAQARGRAAEGLADAGCREQAYALGLAVLKAPVSDGVAIGIGANACLTARGSDVVDVVVATIRARGLDNMRWYSNVLVGLVDAGYPAAAADLARDGLPGSDTNTWEIEARITCLLTASGPTCAEEVAAALPAPRTLSLHTRHFVAAAFAARGCTEVAERFLTGADGQPDLNTYELTTLARALVLTRGRAGAKIVADMVEEQNRSSLDRVIVAEHIAAAGYLAEAHRLWCSVLTRPSAPLPWLAAVAARLVNTGATELALAALDKPASSPRVALIHASAQANEARTARN